MVGLLFEHDPAHGFLAVQVNKKAEVFIAHEVSEIDYCMGIWKQERVSTLTTMQYYFPIASFDSSPISSSEIKEVCSTEYFGYCRLTWHQGIEEKVISYSELCLRSIGPVSPSTNFVGNELNKILH